jgi:hypothetical protein
VVPFEGRYCLTRTGVNHFKESTSWRKYAIDEEKEGGGRGMKDYGE